MDILLPLVLVVAGFYVGWNIGANDAANCIGTTVGAQIISYRKAVAIMALFVILGGVLQGHHVMKTVGKGIVVSDAASYETYN
ncbi:MAG: inorganic phosphate transporter, partial [Gammaproteobacteria bacterium]|nr:inorganic phosphate transporter [Gammaproteobacteria bacterium]